MREVVGSSPGRQDAQSRFKRQTGHNSRTSVGCGALGAGGTRAFACTLPPNRRRIPLSTICVKSAEFLRKNRVDSRSVIRYTDPRDVFTQK